MSVAITSLGTLYNEMSDFKKAKKELEKSYKIQMKLIKEDDNRAYKVFVALTLSKLGESYFNLGKYETALEKYNEGLDHIKDWNTSNVIKRKALIYILKAEVYEKIGMEDKVEENNQKAIDIMMKIKK